MAHSAMQGIPGCSEMWSLVWSSVSQGGWVRRKGGKDYLTILINANFIFVVVKPGISNNLVVFSDFT